MIFMFDPKFYQHIGGIVHREYRQYKRIIRAGKYNKKIQSFGIYLEILRFRS